MTEKSKLIGKKALWNRFQPNIWGIQIYKKIKMEAIDLIMWPLKLNKANAMLLKIKTYWM